MKKMKEEYKYNESEDLFSTSDLIPKNVAKILDTFNEDVEQYKEMDRLCNELTQIGYTFDLGLDATPYNLRKIT